MRCPNNNTTTFTLKRTGWAYCYPRNNESKSSLLKQDTCECFKSFCQVIDQIFCVNNTRSRFPYYPILFHKRAIFKFIHFIRIPKAYKSHLEDDDNARRTVSDDSLAILSEILRNHYSHNDKP